MKQGELGLPCSVPDQSDAFGLSGVEMFVSFGAARVRDLFERARNKAPAIIFIDELDALGRDRGAYGIGGHDEKQQPLNQLPSEMDGFDSSAGLVLPGNEPSRDSRAGAAAPEAGPERRELRGLVARECPDAGAGRAH